MAVVFELKYLKLEKILEGSISDKLPNFNFSGSLKEKLQNKEEDF